MKTLKPIKLAKYHFKGYKEQILEFMDQNLAKIPLSDFVPYQKAKLNDTSKPFLAEK